MNPNESKYTEKIFSKVPELWGLMMQSTPSPVAHINANRQMCFLNSCLLLQAIFWDDFDFQGLS